MEEAAAVFAKLLERRPASTAEAHYGVGLGLLATGRPQQAESEFRQALGQNAAHLGARYQLSVLSQTR